MAQPLNLSIEGMHCGGCVNRVTNALKKLEGVRVVDVQVGAAQLELESATAQACVEAVNKLGFTAREA